MPDRDADELEAIKRRKMQEYERKRAIIERQTAEAKNAPQKPKPEDDLNFVKSKLLGRGQEVLDAALFQYPKPTVEVVKYISNLYRTGQLNEDIPGEDLYDLFHSLGMMVRLNTTISYVKDGKRVPLSQKFKKGTA